MDALALVHEEPRVHEWLGQLSMSIALATRTLEHSPTAARSDLERTLREFLRSGVVGEELAQMLREEMR